MAPAPIKGAMECCTSVHATADGPFVTVHAPPALEQLFRAVIAFEFPKLAPPSIEPAETGPPAEQSFTELVLHRSLRSHAPPVIA
jgi:hypothetical protein